MEADGKGVVLSLPKDQDVAQASLPANFVISTESQKFADAVEGMK